MDPETRPLGCPCSPFPSAGSAGLPPAGARPDSWRPPKSGPAWRRGPAGFAFGGPRHLPRPRAPPEGAQMAAFRPVSCLGPRAGAPGGAVGRLCLGFPLLCPSGHPDGGKGARGLWNERDVIMPVTLWLRGRTFGVKCPRIRRQLWVLSLERGVPPLRLVARASPSPDPRPPKSLLISSQAASFGGNEGGEIYQGRFLFVSRAGWVWGRLASSKHEEEM